MIFTRTDENGNKTVELDISPISILVGIFVAKYAINCVIDVFERISQLGEI